MRQNYSGHLSIGGDNSKVGKVIRLPKTRTDDGSTREAARMEVSATSFSLPTTVPPKDAARCHQLAGSRLFVMKHGVEDHQLHGSLLR